MKEKPATESLTSVHLQEPVFTERWLGLSYTFSGTFILDGKDLTPERAKRDFYVLYDATLFHRKRRRPRGVARFFLVPIYCAASFHKETWEYLFGYNRPSRWAVAMKPVLYNSRSNNIEAKDAVQNDTLAYYWYLKELFGHGISRAAQHFDHQSELTTDSYDDLVAKLLSRRNSSALQPGW